MKHNVPKNIIRTEDDVRIIHGKLMEIEQQQVVDKFSKMMKLFQYQIFKISHNFQNYQLKIYGRKLKMILL